MIGAAVGLAMAVLSTHARAAHNPCNTPDPGFGRYGAWEGKLTKGRALIPKRGGVTSTGGFDVIVHFHGGEAARKHFVPANLPVVLVAIDEGIGSSAYVSAFGDPNVMMNLLRSVARRVRDKRGLSRAWVRHLGLSSWSAGYGATREILKQPVGAYVDAVILLDSLYASYADEAQHTPQRSALEPFVGYARLAMRKKRFLFQSHSQIRTPGYASTREVSAFLVQLLGGKMRAANTATAQNMTLVEHWGRGRYQVRGYAGDDKPDHCAHLGLLTPVLKQQLAKRWALSRAR